MIPVAKHPQYHCAHIVILNEAGSSVPGLYAVGINLEAGMRALAVDRNTIARHGMHRQMSIRVRRKIMRREKPHKVLVIAAGKHHSVHTEGQDDACICFVDRKIGRLIKKALFLRIKQRKADLGTDRSECLLPPIQSAFWDQIRF